MDFISRYLFRGAGFLVAAQIFLTFGLTSDDLTEKLIFAGKLAVFPIPLLLLGGLMTDENGLRAAGFNILLWAIGGAVAFFGAVYGDPDIDGIRGVPIPQVAELSVGFGFANLACMVLAGLGLWLSGVKREPPAGTYHSVG